MAAQFDMEAVMEIEHGFGNKSKKPVDDTAPKRYLSAFFLWANKTRPSVMKNNPDLSVGEIGRILGDMWKKTTSADRASYEAKAEKNKSAYHSKVDKYKKSSGYKKFQMVMHAWKIHETKKPYPKDTNAPKRPLSGYMLYAASVRSTITKENPEFTAAEVMKEQSTYWKALSAKDRKPWLEKAEKEKEKYQKKLARYMKTSDYQTWVDGRNQYKQEMKEKRNKLMGIKKKRARSESKPKAAKKQKRSRTPKASKRSSSRKRSYSRKSSKRRARTPKAPKKSASRSVSRRSSSRKSRKSKTPRASKRSSTRSVSRSASKKSKSRRARTPKSASRSSSRRRSARKSSRKSNSRSASRRSSKKSKSSKRRSSRRRSSGRRARRKAKAPKKVEDVATE